MLQKREQRGRRKEEEEETQDCNNPQNRIC
jgi:hypothetical protein